MKNTQKGFSTLLGIIILLVIAGGVYFYTQDTPKEIKEEATIENDSFSAGTEKKVVNENPASIEEESIPVPKEIITEKASGIITAIYTKNTKNYLDIDYVEFNQNWKPGGMSGSAYENNNPKIRTFEISSDAKFIVGSPANKTISFAEFEQLFAKPNNYQSGNPWDIVITDGIITQITEHFVS